MRNLSISILAVLTFSAAAFAADGELLERETVPLDTSVLLEGVDDEERKQRLSTLVIQRSATRSSCRASPMRATD